MNLHVIDRAEAAELVDSSPTILAIVAPVKQSPDQLLRFVHGFSLIIEAQFVLWLTEEALDHSIVPTAVLGRHAANFQQLPVPRCPAFDLLINLDQELIGFDLAVPWS